MAKDDKSSRESTDLVPTSSGLPGWLKVVGGGILLIVGLVLLVKIATFLFKWALILLVIYGVYRLARHLLSGGASDEGESVLEIEQGHELDQLGVLEQERDLDELKVKMTSKD